MRWVDEKTVENFRGGEKLQKTSVQTTSRAVLKCHKGHFKCFQNQSRQVSPYFVFPLWNLCVFLYVCVCVCVCLCVRHIECFCNEKATTMQFLKPCILKLYVCLIFSLDFGFIFLFSNTKKVSLLLVVVFVVPHSVPAFSFFLMFPPKNKLN